MSQFLGKRGTKLNKLEGENIGSKFIMRGTNKEIMQEHIRAKGNFGRQQGKKDPPQGDPQYSDPFKKWDLYLENTFREKG